MGAMPVSGDVWDMLCTATRYVIQKSPAGLTVGLHLDRRFYGEGHSPQGDLDHAIRAAYAVAVDQRDRRRAEAPSASGPAEAAGPL